MPRPRPAEVIGGDRTEAQALERRRCERGQREWRCCGRRCCGGQAGGAQARRSRLVGQAEASSHQQSNQGGSQIKEAGHRARQEGRGHSQCHWPAWARSEAYSAQATLPATDPFRHSCPGGSPLTSPTEGFLQQWAPLTGGWCIFDDYVLVTTF